MDQSQGGNPFGRLIEFARPHKTGYIVSVVLAVLGVAFGIVPYFATARMTIELLSGNRDLSFYMVWCLISGGCFVLKAILMGISTRASHEATFEVLSEARRKIASKLTRVPMGYILNTPSGQLKNGMVERIEQLEVPLAHVIPEMTSSSRTNRNHRLFVRSGLANGVSIADYHSCWNDVLHGNDEGISQEVWGSCKSWKSHERNNGRIHRRH